MVNDVNFLKHFITEELYIVKENPSGSHIQVAEEKAEYVSPKSGAMIILGDYKDKENETLIKLLAAIKVTDPAFATTLDLNSGHANYLLFGVNSDFEKYKITSFQGAQILNSDSIAALGENKKAKYQLWEQLQKMFP